MIDLRSDTATRPSPEMRVAIANAEVGDDVLGEDPTMNLLEARTAEILGKEAAVYMPSGTMTNQVAVRTHTEPGDEILLDRDTHIYYYEAGAPSALSGVMVRLIDGKRGIFAPSDVEAAVRPGNIHFPIAKLLVIENTHNRGGGAVWPLPAIAAASEAARAHGLKVHLDGARLWNASAATGIPEAEYAKYFDSVSVCFSKGLGAPVGSALAGTKEFIERARRFRKQFGGGMRQAGMMAAGALYALEHNRARLVEDHANAKLLASGIRDLPGVELDISSVETNIVMFRVTSRPASELSGLLREKGLLMNANGPETIRAVTHLDVSRADIERAVEIMRTLMSK